MPPNTPDQLNATAAGAKNAKDELDDLNRAMGDFLQVGAQGSGKIKEVAGAFDKLNTVAKHSTGFIEKILDNTAKMARKIPGALGETGYKALSGLSQITTAMTGLMTGIGKTSQKVITSLDSQTRGLRDFENDMFSLEKRFGGTIEASQKFADQIRTTTSSEFAKSLRMTGSEMGSFMRATAGTTLKQEQLSKVVTVGATSVELYAVATAFAASSAMEAGTAAKILNTLMNKQGKTAQEATNMLSMYAGVAKETGLSIDTIASTLNDAISGFQKIGMAADFGKPILKGFADTMDDMGLGIENAVGLTGTLSKALAGLTNNYGMAYLTFQRGGLDINGGGGGGVLGSSIALQSAYLDAEKTGDQAAISDQLVKGMRDTLTSFTGGDIVTVQQANEDSSLQNQYYVQQQMLGSSFGITDANDAARVLDMLSRLDEAARTGDEKAQEALQEQIRNEMEGRDKTLDEMEKVNRNLEIQINMMAVNMRNDIDATRRAAARSGGLVDEYVSSTGMNLVRKGITSGAATLDGMGGFLDELGITDPQQRERAARILGSSPTSPGGASGQGSVHPMDAALAARGALGTQDVHSEHMKRIIESQLGTGDLARGSTLMKDQIARASMEMAGGATQDQVSQAGGRTELAQQLQTAFENALTKQGINVVVGVAPEARDTFNAAASAGTQMREIGGQ